MNEIFIQAKAPLEFSILSTQDWHFNNSLKKYILELQMNSFFAVAGAWNERPNGSERVRTDVGLGQGALGDVEQTSGRPQKSCSSEKIYIGI